MPTNSTAPLLEARIRNSHIIRTMPRISKGGEACPDGMLNRRVNRNDGGVASPTISICRLLTYSLEGMHPGCFCPPGTIRYPQKLGSAQSCLSTNPHPEF